MRRGITLGNYVIHAGLAMCLGMPFFSSAAAESGPSEGLDLLLMVDPEQFAKDDLAAFRKSILDQAVRYGATERVALKPGETTLNQLVSRVYGYSDKPGPAPFRQIQTDVVNSIVELNNVEPTKIQPGQTFLVPKFIRRPLTKGSSVGIAQVLNTSKSTLENAAQESVTERAWSYTVTSSPLASDPVTWTRKAATNDEAVISNTTQRIGATTLIRVDVDQLAPLGGLQGLREKIHDGTFSFLPSDAQYLVKFDQDSLNLKMNAVGGKNINEPKKAFQLTSEQIQKIRESGPGKLYLLDVFSSTASCTHGDLVYEKAVQTLNSLGLSSEVGRIQKLSIDFYADRSRNTKFIKDWIQKSFRGQALQNYLQSLTILMKAPTPNVLAPGAVAVPGLFLQAIYGTLAEDSSVLVVSGSFHTSTPDNVFPKDIILNERANLINAVLNDTSAIEAPTQYSQEPLNTFNLYRNLLGTVLVGYYDEHGVPHGMYSQTGEGVTTIDDGVVIGATGSCKGIKGTGASYAAPVVATKLLVGRMLWTSRTNVPDAMAARNRLLSSALVRKTYLGKYWSGGAASPARLYAPDGPYLVTPDGKSTAAPQLSGHLTVTVEVPLASGVKLIDYIFDREPGDPSPGFISLLLNDDAVFMLERREMLPPVWKERKVKSICICGDDKKALPLSEAMRFIKEVHRNE